MRSARALALVGSLIAAVAGPARAQPGALSLDQAIAEALRNSPDLGAPEDAVSAADLQRRQAAASFGLRVAPTLSSASNPGGFDTRTMGVLVGKRLTTGTDVWVSGSSSEFGGIGEPYRDRGYAVGLSQTLNGLLSRAAAAPLDVARRQVSASSRQLAEARQQLVVAVAEAFYAVVQADRLVEANARALERARTLAAAAAARAQAGLDTRLDVSRAELLAAQAEASLGDRREALADARERFDLLLGRPPTEEPVLAAEDAPVAPAPPVTEADATGAALASNGALLDARQRLVDARQEASIARWRTLPPLTLNVEYARHGFGSPFLPLFQPYNGWHISLSSSYQIDRSSQAVSVATADLAVRAAQRTAREAEQHVTAEARQAARAVARAEAAAAIQRRAFDVARAQLELARLRYERGLADNLTVVDAENSLFQAETACIAGDIERRLSRLRLARVSGTLNPEAPSW